MRKYFLVLVIVVVMFSGLDNLRELSDLAIVKAMGIDITEDGNYRVKAIVLDTSDKENKEKGIMYEAEGPSVHEAIRHIVDRASKKLYIAHMETLILSEEVAKSRLEQTLDFFIRDNEGSNNFYLFIANGCEAKEVIESINKEEIDMKQMIISSTKYRGNSNTKTLNDIIKDILRPGRDILVNSCKVEDEKIVISNMAYFKNWEMLGFLPDEESLICNIINNNSENTIISVGKDEDLIVAEIIDSKSKLELDKKNKQIKIKINFETNISESGKNFLVQTSKDTQEIEELLKERLTSDITNVVDKLINVYNVDIIGIGNLLYRKKDTLFEEEDYLKKVVIIPEVTVRVLNQGGVVKKW